MNLLFAIFLGIYLIAMQTYAEDMNTTEATTTEPEPTTTKIYTSLADLTSGATEDSDDEDCDFTYEVTVSDGEQIDVTICGYEEDEGDGSKTQYVGIQIDQPMDRWVGIGFVLEDDFDETNVMKDAYAMIFPFQSRAFEERKMAGNNQIGEELSSSLTPDSDVTENSRRVIAFTRKATITVDDLSDDQDSYTKYFDFSKFIPVDCESVIYIIWANGALPNAQFSETSYHGTGNRGFSKQKVSAIASNVCGEDDAGSRIYVVYAVIISIVALLFD